MALEEYLVPIRGKRINICFDCKHACGDCEWSRNFKPVPGWKAYPVNRYDNRGREIVHTVGFWIQQCPQFVEG